MQKFYKFLFFAFTFTSSSNLFSQVFWTENFGTGCSQGQLASAYSGTNGAWTITNTGANGAAANTWFVSATEAGMGVNNCGDGCLNNAALTNRTLHVGNVAGSYCDCLCPTGDCGAAYDACNFALCNAGSPQANKRAESPTINCTGKTNITLAFVYMENGEGTNDDGTLWYFDGAVWAQLSNPAKTPVNPCAPQGQWTAYSIALPATANNNPNVKIGFRWVNDINGNGTDPSFAVDDITLSSSSGAAPVANFTASSNNICAGQCINFTDNSTNSPTSWAWTFTGAVPSSSTAQNPTNICYNAAGTYTVTLAATNGNGTGTTSQVITVNAIPTVTITPASPSICAGGSVGLNASGASTYTWTPGTGLSCTTCANPTANPTATTTYTVTGSSGPGCTKTAAVTVTVNPNPTVTITPSSPSYCTGGSTGLTASGASTYSWTPATGLSCTTCANPTASPTATTTYTVTGTSGGCTGTAAVTVTVNPNPTVTITPSSPSYCTGGSTGLTANGASTYLWSPATGLSCTTCANPTASPTATTTYTVTGTSGAGCTSTAAVTVTVNPNPTVTITPASPSYCAGGSVNLSASGASTYLWSPSTGLSCTTCANPIANPTATTTYTVTGTSGSNCTNTATVTVTVNPLPNASVTPSSATICNGGNVTLTASGGVSYLWTPATGLSCTTCANPTASPTTNTTYTVTVTGANSCTATATVAITVTSSIVATASATPPAICIGGSTTLNGGGGTGYTWTPSGSLNCSTCQNPTASPTSTTTYMVTVSSGSCPTATATVMVTVNPLPVITVTPPSATICTGQQVAATSTGGITCTWTPTAGVSNPNSCNTNLSPTSTTTYTVTGTDANSCSNTAAVTITVNPLPTVTTSGNVTICTGGNTPLTASGGVSCTWSPATGLNNANSCNPTASPTSTTTYTVTVTDGNGCTNTASLTVTVNPCAAPVAAFTASATTLCENDCIDFTDNSTSSPTNWSWTFTGANPSSSALQNPTSICYGTAGTYTVTLVASNSFGSNSTSMTVTVNPNPTASAGSSTTITIGNSTTLNATGGGTYLWSTGETSSSITVSPTASTQYCVTVNSNGCSDTSCVWVYVDVTCGDVFVPNAFSPNNDGMNDVLYVRGNCIKTMSFRIYDRWGEKVFETADPKAGWDGTFRGKLMDAAVFGYHLDAELLTGETVKMKGNITLVR